MCQVVGILGGLGVVTALFVRGFEETAAWRQWGDGEGNAGCTGGQWLLEGLSVLS